MGLTVLLTIHGIGFQQFPDDAAGVAGYADGLQAKLHRALGGTLLGDDPERTVAGPVYVSSHYPPEKTFAREEGLKRLDRPLAPAGSAAAHVALVYVPSEETAPDPGSMTETIARGVFGVGHYATVRGAVSMIFHDIGAALHHGPPAPAADGEGELKVRSDVHKGRHPVMRALQFVTPQAAPHGSGLLEVLRTVEDDVAAYVSRNDLRQRVRDFVHLALFRLAQRTDVDSIVVNAHSQGTVVAFDVVRQMSPEVTGRIRWLITAGSPLRKYAEMLSWGNDTGAIAQVPQWLNAWDRFDPVADPLEPDATWKRGQEVTPQTPRGLFQNVNWADGTQAPAGVVDCEVRNVTYVPGSGLRAHDYWGDVEQFVTPLAAVLQDVATGAHAMAAADFASKFAAT